MTHAIRTLTTAVLRLLVLGASSSARPERSRNGHRVPLALGSYWGMAFLFLNVPILMLRILDEEAMLRQELEGYADYTRHVRSRLVPGLW